LLFLYSELLDCRQLLDLCYGALFSMWVYYILETFKIII
jgi:hypothetical protein